MAAIELLSTLEAAAATSNASSSAKPTPTSGGASSHMSYTRLPKLEICKFKGDITMWQTFWDQFETIVHGSDIPVANKFSYLRSLLEGEALETISGLSLTDANYIIAHDCLKERHARPE
jgi:hypothetical protein